MVNIPKDQSPLHSPRLSNQSSTSTTSSIDPLVAALRSSITPIGLATIASRIRGVPLAECTVDLENPIYGSFNLVHVVTFSDKLKWAARIPLHGLKESFHEGDAKALEAQALTMQFIKQNTSVPIPEVVHYDPTFENELGAPFMLMTWLEGKPINLTWHDSDCDTDQTLEMRREKILRSTAKAMIQLRFFTAPKLGELEFETTNDKNDNLRVKGIKNFHSLHLDEVSEDILFTDLGPFENTRDFLTALAIDSQPDFSVHKFALGERKLLQIMIDAIPTVDHEQFVLAHPDYDVQNFLVDEEGSLTGILDWDGVATYPRCVGYSRYPGWITRDWDPLVYGYGHEIPHGKKEDSPETLRRLRKLYHRIIEEELGEEEAKGMINSHLMEAIEIAARNPMNASTIINLLARRCIKEPLFEVAYDDDDDGEEEHNREEEERNDEDDNQFEECKEDGGGNQNAEEPEDSANDQGDTDVATTSYEFLWVFDLCQALGKGRVSEEQIGLLRARFKEVLMCTTHIVE